MMNKDTLKNYLKENELKNKEIEFIEKLIKLRYTNNLSQQELADKLKMKQPAIARMESARTSPSLNTVLKILNVYGYTLDIKKDLEKN